MVNLIQRRANGRFIEIFGTSIKEELNKKLVKKLDEEWTGFGYFYVQKELKRAIKMGLSAYKFKYGSLKINPKHKESLWLTMGEPKNEKMSKMSTRKK